MYSKEMVLSNCYQEMSDALLDLLKYEFVGVDIENTTIQLLTKMIDDCQHMIDHIEDYEWSDVMKVRQTNYTVIRMINTLLINQYDKILTHKNR